jgi:D-3-phosphoglycerate dehydrogenase / 2-oxoglutarate reductase
MTPKRVLVTARAFWASGQRAAAALSEAGFAVVHSPEAGPYLADRLAPLLADFDAIIGSSDDYSVALFRACPRLKVVSRCGVGIDSVDLAAATAAGVIVTNTPGTMTDAVADYTFALMLSLARRIVESDAMMRSGGWGEFPGVLVWGKTLGLVGCGQIGQAVARRAAGFGMRILAFDPRLAASGKGALPPGMPSIEFVELSELLARSDFVSVHAPSLPETRDLFDERRFEQMKPTAYLINTARGALIDEAALARALESRTIAGAAIDVYGQEPLPADHPLRRAPRCILTPHNAFNAAEAAEAMSTMSAQNIIALWAGRCPDTVCNPAVWQSPHLRLTR